MGSRVGLLRRAFESKRSPESIPVDRSAVPDCGELDTEGVEQPPRLLWAIQYLTRFEGLAHSCPHRNAVCIDLTVQKVLCY